MANTDPDADVLIQDISSMDHSDVEDHTILPDQPSSNDAEAAQVSNIASHGSNNSPPSLSSIKRSGLVEFRLAHPALSTEFKTIDRQMKSVEKTILRAENKAEREYIWLAAYKCLLATAEKSELNVTSLDEHIPALRVVQGSTVQEMKPDSMTRRAIIMQIEDGIDWNTGKGPEYKLIGGIADELPLFYPRQLLIQPNSEVPDDQMLATLNSQLEEFIKKLSSVPRMRKYGSYGSDGEVMLTCFSLDIACHYANFFSDLIHVEGLERLHAVFTSAPESEAEASANVEYRLPVSAVLKMAEHLSNADPETRGKAFYRSLSQFVVTQKNANAYTRFVEYYQRYQAGNVLADMVSNVESNSDDQTTRDIIKSCEFLPQWMINNTKALERVIFHFCTHLGISHSDFMGIYDSLVIMQHLVSKFGVGILPLLPHEALVHLKLAGCDAHLPEILNEFPFGLNSGLQRIADEIMPVITQSKSQSMGIRARELLGGSETDAVGKGKNSFCGRIDAALNAAT